MPSAHTLFVLAVYVTAAGLFFTAAVHSVRRGKRTEAELRARLASADPVYNNTSKPVTRLFVPELPPGTQIAVKQKPPVTRKSG